MKPIHLIAGLGGLLIVGLLGWYMYMQQTLPFDEAPTRGLHIPRSAKQAADKPAAPEAAPAPAPEAAPAPAPEAAPEGSAEPAMAAEPPPAEGAAPTPPPEAPPKPDEIRTAQ